MSKELILIRHGDSVIDSEDPDSSALSHIGKSLSVWLKDNLEIYKSDIVVAEDVTRCIETVRPAAQKIQLRMIRHQSSSKHKNLNNGLPNNSFDSKLAECLEEAFELGDRVIYCYRKEAVLAIEKVLGSKKIQEFCNGNPDILYSNIMIFSQEEEHWSLQKTISHPFKKRS